ncbi:unnamed protein product [Calypogeia fissa]
MFVTKRSMEKAVASILQKLDSVSPAIFTVKQRLTSQLDALSRIQEHNSAVTNAMEPQVRVIRGELAKAVVEMRDLQKEIEGLAFASEGVVLLCRYSRNDSKVAKNSCRSCSVFRRNRGDLIKVLLMLNPTLRAPISEDLLPQMHFLSLSDQLQRYKSLCSREILIT